MRSQLCYGHPRFDEGFGKNPDLDEVRRVWDEYRLEAWAKLESMPGRRPWGWWQFEAPEPRSEEPEAVQLGRLGLLRGEEIQWLLKTFEERGAAVERHSAHHTWPVEEGQALELVGALSPTEIGALREQESLRERRLTDYDKRH